MILIIGKEESAKSTLAARLAVEISKDPTKILYFDFDETSDFVQRHYKIIIDELPWTMDASKGIDHQERVTHVVEKISNPKQPILVFDGLGGYLSECEALMRIEVNTPISEDLRWKYWTIRNQIFLNTMQAANKNFKTVIATGHESFNEPSDRRLNEHLHAKALLIIKTVKGADKDGNLVYVGEFVKYKEAPWLVGTKFAIVRAMIKEKKIKIEGMEMITTIAKTFS